MPVSGRELASLDFANLIGGPLNAIVEAQAKSAITTVNFIKQVAFDKDGKIINVNFTYNRKNDEGKDQEFTLTVPFLTMLPVPYITVDNALIEFNAKITSVNESKIESDFTQNVDVDVAGFWYVAAKVQSKTSYQRKSATTEKEERTFDMHVKVEARNQDMPAGTERLLTILENSISERAGPTFIEVIINVCDETAKNITVKCENGKLYLKDGLKFSIENVEYEIATCDESKDTSGNKIEDSFVATISRTDKKDIKKTLLEGKSFKVKMMK